jgi:hypothetical protein
MDLDKLNSATKYPSILTYHALGERGALTEELTTFAGITPDEEVYLTEKVDGTNGRIVLLPDGDYFIGSREELLYAKGDRIQNPALNIVETLQPLAEQLTDGSFFVGIHTLYLEVYGGKIGGQAKQYSGTGRISCRLFDVSYASVRVLDKPREEIASWRDGGGQDWFSVKLLGEISEQHTIPLVPYLEVDNGEDLPKSVQDMYGLLLAEIPETRVGLDDKAGGKPEGLVLRTADRSRIAKARFQDYERTLKRRK